MQICNKFILAVWEVFFDKTYRKKHKICIQIVSKLISKIITILLK